jgi:hypothetical protein
MRRVLMILLMGILAAGTHLPSRAHAASDPARKCAAAKVKAASQKAARKLDCYRHAVALGLGVDPTCLARAEAKFNAAFASAESRGGCVTTIDAATIEGAVDDFVLAVSSALPATTTTSLPPSTCGLEGAFCSGTCNNGGTCQVLQQCFCGGQPFCACSPPGVTFTTCTVPPVCPTTTTLP